ncbi:MAG: oligosaccharide repeat unit polymerase [Euryarchaeota archaeon]|nr:oligosaccharide repeat unit polymerase [Euryarchaeota archaeon]
MKNFCNPNIFIPLYTLFIAAGLFFKDEYLEYSVTPLLFFYIGYGLFCFYLGTKIDLKIKKEYTLILIAVLLFFYSFKTYSYLAFLILPSILLLLRLDFEKYATLFYFTGIALLIGNLIYIGDIPLLNPDSKREALTVLLVCGYSLVYIGAAFQMVKRFHPLYFFLAFGILIFYGYRSYILIFFLSTVIMLYYTKRFRSSFWALGLGLGVVVLLTFVFLQFTSQQWELGVFDLIFHRTAYTVYVLNEIVEKSGLFGQFHGLWLHPITGNIVGKTIFGYDHNTTSTILGPLILDFGIFEVPLMTFFGSVLGTLWRKARKKEEILPYYAILLSITVVCIELSPVPLIIFPYLIALYKIS